MFRKIIHIHGNVRPGNVRPVPSTIAQTPNNDQYKLRKSMQMQYKVLFQALFKIPDRAMQKRVLDAINGVGVQKPDENSSVCSNCRLKRLKTTDTATQTLDNKANEAPTPEKCGAELLFNTPTTTTSETASVEEVEALSPLPKKRKRKWPLPQVFKESQVRQPASASTAKTKKPKVPTSADEELPKSCSMADDFTEPSKIAAATHTENLKLLEQDLVLVDKELAGFLPIHHAILMNDFLQLQRQVAIWRRVKKCDLNALLTSDTHRNCLQLAIINNSPLQIVNFLLDSGLNVQALDGQSNSVIHLALINVVDLPTLQVLMDKIELSLLLQCNDEGLSALHLAVRADLHLQAELLLNTLDRRLRGAVAYERADCDKFGLYYRRACARLGTRAVQCKVADLKRRFLDGRELKTGNTALFYAVSHNLDHLAYLLMAHMAEPRIENYNGETAQTYFSEYSKLYHLKDNMESAMFRVISIRHDQPQHRGPFT